MLPDESCTEEIWADDLLGPTDEPPWRSHQKREVVVIRVHNAPEKRSAEDRHKMIAQCLPSAYTEELNEK